MTILVGPVLLALALITGACVVVTETLVFVQTSERTTALKRLLDPAALAGLALVIVLLALRLRHYS